MGVIHEKARELIQEQYNREAELYRLALFVEELCEGESEIGKAFTIRHAKILTRWSPEFTWGVDKLRGTTLYAKRADGEVIMNMLISSATTNVQVPEPDELREMNPQYFEGLVKRQQQRRAELDQFEGLSSGLQLVLHEMENLASAYQSVLGAMRDHAVNSYTVADWYELRKLALPECMCDSNQARHLSTSLA